MLHAHRGDDGGCRGTMTEALLLSPSIWQGRVAALISPVPSNHLHPLSAPVRQRGVEACLQMGSTGPLGRAVRGSRSSMCAPRRVGCRAPWEPSERRRRRGGSIGSQPSALFPLSACLCERIGPPKRQLPQGNDGQLALTKVLCRCRVVGTGWRSGLPPSLAFPGAVEYAGWS